jgi:nucleotide-binding universal stress UspA family protein
MRRILVGFDGSDGGRRALDRAIEEAEASTVHLTVISVENMPLDPEAPRHFGTLGDISASEGAPLAAPPDVVQHLQEANERLSKAGVSADLTWAAGEPGAEIVEAAKRVRANLIVVGEHHHGFLSSLFGANVDEEVQRAAGCEVVLA